MAHFASVNEDALLSAISSCKSAMASVSNGDIVSMANTMKANGSATRDSIVSAASTIQNSVKNIKSNLEACYGLATLIKEYKFRKAKVDELTEKLATLKAKINSLEGAKNNCYSMYSSLKNKPGRSSEANAYYNKYQNYKSEIAEKQKEYNQYKAQYDSEKAEMERLAALLTGMGFPPESN